jgi:hypothetical protein
LNLTSPLGVSENTHYMLIETSGLVFTSIEVSLLT